MSDTEVWTIQNALIWTEGYLSRKGDENPRISAQWLLSEATGLSRIELYAHFDKPLSPEERTTLRSTVARRGLGEPLQYITGEVGFRHITVKVRPGVLIPRPETEVLVSEALALLPPVRRRSVEWEMPDNEPEINLENSSENVQEDRQELDIALQGTPLQAFVEPPRYLIADLCTGTGCIACSIAHEHPQTYIISTDIDSGAVALAQENVALLELGEKVEVLKGNLGEAISKTYLGEFDLVVSNPPYIPTAVLSEIPAEVSEFEPALALDGGADGLDLFREIVLWATTALRSGGSLIVELHETCLDQAADYAKESGFESTRIVQDLAGRDRILVATLPNAYQLSVS